MDCELSIGWLFKKWSFEGLQSVLIYLNQVILHQILNEFYFLQDININETTNKSQKTQTKHDISM